MLFIRRGCSCYMIRLYGLSVIIPSDVAYKKQMQENGPYYLYANYKHYYLGEELLPLINLNGLEVITGDEVCVVDNKKNKAAYSYNIDARCNRIPHERCHGSCVPHLIENRNISWKPNFLSIVN